MPIASTFTSQSRMHIHSFSKRALSTFCGSESGLGTSLMVQWLGLWASIIEGVGSILGQGNLDPTCQVLQSKFVSFYLKKKKTERESDLGRNTSQTCFLPSTGLQSSKRDRCKKSEPRVGWGRSGVRDRVLQAQASCTSHPNHHPHTPQTSLMQCVHTEFINPFKPASPPLFPMLVNHTAMQKPGTSFLLCPPHLVYHQSHPLFLLPLPGFPQYLFIPTGPDPLL